LAEIHFWSWGFANPNDQRLATIRKYYRSQMVAKNRESRLSNYFSTILRSKIWQFIPANFRRLVWRKINDRNSTRSGSDRQEKLGYLKGSFSRLIDAIAEDVKKHHGKILLNQPVEKIIIQKNQAKGLIAGGKEYLFDEI